MLKIVKVETIVTGPPKHRGFPALSYNPDYNELLLAFREGSDHYGSRDGQVVLMGKIGEKWNSKTFTAKAHEDLRVNHGMVYPYLPLQVVTSTHDVKIKIVDLRDGSMKTLPPVRVFPYGRVTLFRGTMWIPGYTNFEFIGGGETVLVDEKGHIVTLAHHKKFHFTEPDIVNYNGKFIAVIREETGVAFTRESHDGANWSHLKPLDFEAHSPCLLEHKGILLLAYRGLEHYTNKFREDVVKTIGTCIRWSKDGREWSEPLVVEPSHFWDCGYPSMVSIGDDVYCAYYSEFAHGNSDIRLATLRWEP